MNKIKKIVKDFKKEFKEDFVWREAEIWLESKVINLIENDFLNRLPKKISDETIEKEIQNFPKRLDDCGKQKIRAKNYGWNLCVEEIKKLSRLNN